MNNCYFSCFFEDSEWRLRAVVHENQYLLLYEVEPEDRRLYGRFGIKFILQNRHAYLDVRCSHPVEQDFAYEQSLVAGLRKYLLTQWMLP
ncbi:MAG TPA: hypothetical protein VN616_13155 [Puia sp.]|nr:hypothetical protein [Puia sp.]